MIDNINNQKINNFTLAFMKTSRSQPIASSLPGRVYKPQSQSKTLYSFHRNNKSLKVLNIHLKDYREQAANEEKKLFNSVKDHSFSILSKSKEEVLAIHEKAKEQADKDKGFVSKCEALADNLLLNLDIFKKVFSSSKKKRSVISKLYGWDPIFNPIFFNKISKQAYSEQFRVNISKEWILSELGLEKQSFSAQNIYNKLRLFLAELTNANITHQQMQAMQQKNKLVDSCSKLRLNLERLSQDSLTKKNTLKQVQMMRQTHYDMFNMKMRIKNKVDDIEKLARNRGVIKVNPFYLKEERNVNGVEAFIKEVIKKM